MISCRILVIIGKVPWPNRGAAEQDKVAAVKILNKLAPGQVKVIGKRGSNQSDEQIIECERELGVSIKTVPLKNSKNRNIFIKLFYHLKSIIIKGRLLDGAADEYNDKNLYNLIDEELKDGEKTIVVCWTSYLWPLYKHIKKYNAKIVTRSHNVEFFHVLDEHPSRLLGKLLAHTKKISETKVAQETDVMFAVTPNDRDEYDKLGCRRAASIPLCSLGNNFTANEVKTNPEVLNVLFYGSTYNVNHNLQALEILIKEIIPNTNKTYPGKFFFHILGGKMPDEFNNLCKNLLNVKYYGFIDDKNEYEGIMKNLDIAVMPSLGGGGMQQKIFEPIARGIPTITSSRGIAGYELIDGQDVLLAETAGDFTKHLGFLLDYDLRKMISENSLKVSKELFSQDVLENLINKEFISLCSM